MFTTSHTTLHRWFWDTDSININQHKRTDNLIADGEEELVRRLKKLTKTHQLCLFHMTHELTPLLQYKDFVSKEQALKLSETLNDFYV